MLDLTPQTFGDKLRHEREVRNTPIAEVSRRTRIGLQYLEALETNDFGALPGRRGFAKLYIRAYADMFGFDARPLIDEFDREFQKQTKSKEPEPRAEPPRVRRIRYVPPPRKQVAIATPRREKGNGAVASTPPDVADSEPDVEPLPSIADPEATPMAVESPPMNAQLRRTVALVVLVAAVVVVVAGLAQRNPSFSGPTPPAEQTTTPAEEDPAPEPTIPEPSDARPPSEPATSPLDAPAMRIVEQGVGTGVADRRLVGQGTRFKTGTEAFFFTKVVDGGPGGTLRHVWYHEGRVIQSIKLPVGSASWRTYSKKRLRADGRWTVEARSPDDRTLARVEFLSGP